MRDCQFNRALEAIWKFLAEINGYIVTRQPWKIRKEEGPDSASSTACCRRPPRECAWLRCMLSPFTPATSRKIFETFALPGQDPVRRDLDWGGLPVSVPMPDAPALFPRVDLATYFKGKDAPMTEPTQDPAAAAPAAPAAPVDDRISIEDFQKIRLKTAKIVAAERVPKSNKLMRLQVDLGGEQRQIVAGIAAQYEPEALLGRNVVVVANLKPAKLMGVESNGMVLAASVGEAGEPVLLDVPAEVPPGARSSSVLADSHCHLQMGGGADELIARARPAGVTQFLVPGTTLADSAQAAELAASRDGVLAAVGVHPHEAKDFDPSRDGAAFEALARRPKVAAIGEVGLDFHYDHSPRGKQIEVLEWMLDCARRLSLPVLLHNRESGAEMLALLARRGARERAGVYHSFTEDAAYGKKAIDLGYLVSFSGMITFRAAENIRSAAAGLPLEAMLVETDTPFLAPVPHRGKPSEPAFVVETAKKLAEVKGVDFDAVAATTTQNFDRLSLLPLPPGEGRGQARGFSAPDFPAKSSSRPSRRPSPRFRTISASTSKTPSSSSRRSPRKRTTTRPTPPRTGSSSASFAACPSSTAGRASRACRPRS